MTSFPAIILLVLSVFPVTPFIPSQEDPIQSIRQHYTSINQKVASYRKVKKALSGYSAEGGELLAYFHGPSIMKMVATHMGETGKATEEYYYWQGKLIFVLRTDFRYDKPFGKVVSKRESRFYFKDDKLIKWINEDGKEVVDPVDTEKQQSDVLKSSNELSEGARSKNNTIESKQ
jgi:hypothetical protein